MSLIAPIYLYPIARLHQMALEIQRIWLENCRGLVRDYERLPENHEAMVYIAMIRLMLRRLESNRRRWNSDAT
ncbi:MAG: transposase [Leptolyngbyaceae cyanobacterium bins.302]|nr:transposase [Leptolyngbyaceae cyanobacterium bins.302]